MMAFVYRMFCRQSKERAFALADALLDEEGCLYNLDRVELLYSAEPSAYNDPDSVEHCRRVVDALSSDRVLVHQIESLRFPLFDPKLEEMFAVMLGISGPISERDLKRGVLSALLCPLRQSVGSCFATAPAILIHAEQFSQFLKDMRDLLVEGKLTRTFGGVSYVVPISPSPGLGDLKVLFDPDHPGFKSLNLSHVGKGKTFLDVLSRYPRSCLQFIAYFDHLLLKIWEFTLASFVDVKAEFSRWNLFTSLGLNHEEKGGIGEIVYTQLDEKLQKINVQAAQYQAEYEIAFDQLRATQGLLRRASTESEGRRLRAEYQARLYHANSCKEMRDRFVFRSKNTASFFRFLIEQIVDHFPEHFQEIYDAQMQEFDVEDCDDAPAGFRLLYKHGRTHVGSWEFIHSSEEYIQALHSFFLAIEPEMVQKSDWEGSEEEINQIITKIVHHLQDESFLASANYRIAKAHEGGFSRGSKWRKPWVYISGGTLPTLLNTYFRRERDLSYEGRWVDSPQDLLIFLLDTLKSLPSRTLDLFISDPKKRMLMTSPTHAFSLLPGVPFFRKGWEEGGFSYTWVRDQILFPSREFFQKIRLSQEQQLYLVNRLSERLPLIEGYDFQKHYPLSKNPLTLTRFRDLLPRSGKIDALLFELLPLVDPEKGESFLFEMGIRENLSLSTVMGRRELHDWIVARAGKGHVGDFHKEVALLMQKRGLAPPPALIFADSNWEVGYFSFVVSPFSEELEVWQTDRLGITGSPLRNWEPYLDGTIREPWTLFVNPYDYMA